MMSLKQTAITFAVTALFTVQSHAYTISGNNSNISSTNSYFSWDRAQFSSLRAALEDQSNFGANGTVNLEINTVNTSTITPTALQGIDAFVSASWITSDSSAYNQMIVDAFLNGMDLVLLQDHSSRSGIGGILGLTPSFNASTNYSQTVSSPLSDGPFGTVTSANVTGVHGYLFASQVSSKNGTACMTDDFGLITGACWAAGE